jgi:hypothetical protein
MAKKTKGTSSIGGQAQDIFSSTERTQPVELLEEVRESTRGRPKELPADAVKSTVTFFNSQIVWLDRLSTSIREKSKSVVDRSALIRAILTAIEESGLDLTNALSEEEITSLILQKLREG